jgi:formamidase
MFQDEAWDEVAIKAARTVPGRENGGNCDIKNLSRGCVVYFPVFVDGAMLSMGDMHMSQGDGEVVSRLPGSLWYTSFRL